MHNIFSSTMQQTVTPVRKSAICHHSDAKSGPKAEPGRYDEDSDAEATAVDLDQYLSPLAKVKDGV